MTSASVVLSRRHPVVHLAPLVRPAAGPDPPGLPARQLPPHLHDRQHILPLPHHPDRERGGTSTLREHQFRGCRPGSWKGQSDELADSTCPEECVSLHSPCNCCSPDPETLPELGNPADDLPLATVIFLIDSALVLLRPRKASSHHSHRRSNSLRPSSPSAPVHKRANSLRPLEPEEVKYDFQVLADRVETYWTHLSGIGTLENSLWAWDGERLRVWLDALTVDRVESGGTKGEERGYKRVGESVSIPLDFYPLCEVSFIFVICQLRNRS